MFSKLAMIWAICALFISVFQEKYGLSISYYITQDDLVTTIVFSVMLTMIYFIHKQFDADASNHFKPRK